MNVRRITTTTGSRIEPPLDQDWPPLKRLEWKAAVVAHDTALPVYVLPCPRAGLGAYEIGVKGASGGAPYGFREAWTYLSGLDTGIHAARCLDPKEPRP